VDLNANATASRNPLQFYPGKISYANANIDARWELDLFGANSAARQASLARVSVREEEWQGARLSLAAEVANTYVALRSCEAMQDLAEQYLASQQLSQQLWQQRAEAGFLSAVELAQNNTLVANAATQLQQQKTECAVTLKALAVLTVMPEAELREKLAAGHAHAPQAAGFVVEAVPAQAMLKRPDMRAALQALMAAAAEIGMTEAQRYPSLSLTGSIGAYGLRVAGQTEHGSTWSFGPVLDLPLFDAGRRRAAVDNAKARYEEALAGFKQQALLSVKEVEEALVRLDAANRNLEQQAKIDTARELALQAANSGLRSGSYSVLDKEEVLRQHLLGQQQKLQLQRDRASAWIALYKAVGGGWQADQQANTTAEAAR
jgi:NodT family efflux transporter outer membrane factor (OMF) lipoprotein